MSRNDIIDLDSEFIVICVPADTVEVDITAKVYVDHDILTVGRHMDFKDVREAIKEAQDGYIPSNAIITLAPTKREKLERLLNKYAAEEDL